MKAQIKFGWDYYIMEIDDAVTLMKLLEKMEPVESEYISGQGSVWYTKEKYKPIEFDLRPMNDDDYAVMKMRGPKPKGE